jgi:hypothetical protein
MDGRRITGELDRIGKEAVMAKQGTIPAFAWRN